jgi:transcription-repair coupling factor (superfamily II helicase)
MRDRFGPVPTLIENLLKAMNVRRQMKELLITTAILKGDQLEIKFHPEAPIDSEKLVGLAAANRNTMRLTPSYQIIVRLLTGEYEQIFAQIEGILQALAACEKLEAQAAGPANALPN